jgi:transposase InsO family protein
MPRRRDPRTGRFLSRENTEEPAGPSVPGAFENDDQDLLDTLEASEPIETHRTSETIENIEPTETTEPTERDESNETDETVEDSERQLQEELASGMPEELAVPAYQAVTPQKIATFNTEKLDRTNVSSWKAQYKIFLETQGCWKVVEHTYDWRTNAARVTKLLEDPGWKTSDATAKLYILQNLKVEDKTSVQSLKTSGDMWAYLLEKYERRTQVDVTNAIRKVTRWQMDPKMSLEEAMQQLDQYHAELEDISGGKVKFDNMIVIIFFLDGLPTGYDSMKFSLLAQENLTRGVVLSRLQQQESMIQSAKESESTGETASRVKHLECYNCGKTGHYARDCRAPKKDREESSSREDSQGKSHRKGRYSKAKARGSLKERQKRGRARAAEEESGSDSDSSKSSGASSERGRGAYRVNLDERISDRYEYLLEDNTAYRVKESYDPIIDSGATSTCSGHIELFESLDQRYQGRLGTAGKSIEITGRGTMRIPLSSGKTARISNALYVPKMRQTLLSTQALQDAGVWNKHVKKKYSFFDDEKVILARGYNIGRTSYLRWVRSKNALTARPEEKGERDETAQLVKEIDWELIHQRLGHPGEDRLRMMVKRMGLNTDRDGIRRLKTCETCIQAKSQKTQSHVTVPRASRPLKRVYMDFWGPYNGVKCKDGWRYYLSLTDDCTRLSWIYLTKDREATTVQGILEEWLAWVEREKGVKLLTIRTDNAKEFKALKPWAKKQGIWIEFSEPGTPQQNGVAERLNRLLLEITRAILIGADVPKQYWPEAIHMANHLRNRTIQVQDSKKTPYELWTGHQADISRCRTPFCRVWFHQKEMDKLEPRAIEGVFMGYDMSRKHYLVMAKRDRKVYRVTDPIFLEDKKGFISKEPGEREKATEQVSGTLQGIAPGSAPENIISSGETAGGSDTSRPRDEPENIRDLDTGTVPVQGIAGAPEIQVRLPTPQPPEPEQPHPGDAGLKDSVPRRSGRIRKPTQAAVESNETEALWRKSRTRSHREEGEERSPSPRLQVVAPVPSALE